MCLQASLVLAVGLAAGVAAGGAGPVPSAPVPPAAAAAPATALSRDHVEQVVEQLRQDPDLGGKRKVRRLQFKSQDQPDTPKPPRAPWALEFFRWLAETSRLLVWVLGAAAVAVLLVGLRRWLHWHRGRTSARLPELPSHVRDLDIRRASLPADVGAAARTLWQQGQARPALSLLYRGALSRLVHAHAVPIRAASTEDECVRLARTVLAPETGDFFARLVRAWQLAVYGARLPDEAEVLALCAGFDAHMGRHEPAPQRPPGQPGAVAT